MEKKKKRREAQKRAKILWQLYKQKKRMSLTAAECGRALKVRSDQVHSIYLSFERNGINAPPYYRTAKHKRQMEMDAMPRIPIPKGDRTGFYCGPKRPWYDPVLGECWIAEVK